MIRFVPHDLELLRPSYLQAGPEDADTLFVLLHGFPDTARVWEPLIAALPASHMKIAPFAPGTDGVPPVSRKDSSLLSRRDGIMRLIRAAENGEEKQIVLVAHDLGGALIAPLQEELGSVVVSSIYINSLTLQQFYQRKTSPRQLWRSFYMILFQCPLLNRRTLSPVSGLLLKTIYDLGGLPKEDELRKGNGDVLWGIESYRQYARDLLRQIGRSVEKVATPTLFLHGERDPFILPASEAELTKFFENSELVSLDAGHWPQRGPVAAVCEHIMAFVSRCFRQPSLLRSETRVEMRPSNPPLVETPEGEHRS